LVLLPIAASLVAVVFAVRTGRVARRSRSTALAVWSFSLAQFAAASAALAWGVAFGWTGVLFRVFYVFGAVVNVIWLALGTIWLLSPRPVAWTAAAVVTAATAYAVVAVVSAAFVAGAAHAIASESIPVPSHVMPHSVRLLSRWYSIGGSVVVIAGLVWSLLRRGRHTSGLAILTGGVIVVGIAGELARAGLVAGFSACLAAGIVVMYAGFLRT
jgi:hypothetical protein